jgi:hypothetical protein
MPLAEDFPKRLGCQDSLIIRGDHNSNSNLCRFQRPVSELGLADFLSRQTGQLRSRIFKLPEINQTKYPPGTLSPCLAENGKSAGPTRPAWPALEGADTGSRKIKPGGSDRFFRPRSVQKTPPTGPPAPGPYAGKKPPRPAGLAGQIGRPPAILD